MEDSSIVVGRARLRLGLGLSTSINKFKGRVFDRPSNLLNKVFRFSGPISGYGPSSKIKLRAFQIKPTLGQGPDTSLVLIIFSINQSVN